MLRKRLLLLTGSPGIGKTTVLLKLVDALKGRGCSVGGMVSREVRSGGSRVGFEISDLSTGKTGWLARVSQGRGPRVGKYLVDLEDLGAVGVAAILEAVAHSDVVAIDEIGPMELFSDKFREAVEKAVESSKPVAGIIHWKARGGLIDEIRARRDAEVHVVTFDNRQRLHETLVEKILDLQRKQREDKGL